MPGRHTISAAFLPMAMTAGLTSAIMDARTPQIVEAVKAADLLLGHDEWGWHWIAAHRAKQAARRPQPRRRADRDREPRRSSTGPQRARDCREPAGPSRPRTTAPAGATPRSRRHGRVELKSAPRARGPGAARASPSSTPRRWNGIAIDSTCGGHGTCKKCKVQIDGRHACRSPGSTSRSFTREQLDARLAARLPGPGDPRPRGRRAAADHPAQGRDGRRRAARSSCGRRSRSGTSSSTEPTLADQRTDLARLLDAIDDLELDRRPARAAPAADGAARSRLQGHRRRRGRGARSTSSRATPPSSAVRHRVRPRHDDRRGHPARHRRPARRPPSPRCSTSSSRSAPT